MPSFEIQADIFTRLSTKVIPALVSLIPHADVTDVTVISNYSYDLCVDSYDDISEQL